MRKKKALTVNDHLARHGYAENKNIGTLYIIVLMLLAAFIMFAPILIVLG